ncbi:MULTISPECIES: hypothetical protein [unclassified Acidovorax]|uniref:hypothetical protein n=1 Tax=unclassified Acidovorax TaxID=2684926 RepID=UPI002883171C|nr:MULTISPECIES: hypothetical protein [unclassified Acidovorax]
MKKTFIALLTVCACLPAAWSQDRIYRCGNEYTNNATQAKERGCKVVEGGNVTVLQSSRPAAAPSSGGGGGSTASSGSAAAPVNTPRVGASDQRARDSDARAILESELRKAESRQAELVREYNNGMPEKSALELRNTQVYQDRLTALKASLARADSDVAGIKRELARLPAAN